MPRRNQQLVRTLATVFKGIARGKTFLEQIDDLEQEFKLVPKERRSRLTCLRFAVKMNELLLWHLYMERGSTPRPLQDLHSALKEKLDCRPSFLLDGEARYGQRYPYSRDAYRLVQATAAEIVEAWVQVSKKAAGTTVGRMLGVRAVKPIEAARPVAQTLWDAGFVPPGRGQDLHGAENPVERLAQTIRTWRNQAERGTALFQSYYHRKEVFDDTTDPVARYRCSGPDTFYDPSDPLTLLLFNKKAALAHLVLVVHKLRDW